MDTLEFFQSILPPTGSYYLATINKPRKGSKSKSFTIHYDYDSLEALAAGVEAHKNNTGINLYHACGSYKEPFLEANGQKSYRVEANWAEAKSLWVDLDCGQAKYDKGEGYLNKKAAVDAMAAFCATAQFPTPMIVDSGNGIHCYWPLTKAIPAAKWKVLATTFKSVLAHHGVLADPTCTADFARILRPAGAFNNKGDVGKLVQVRHKVEPIKASLIAERLKELVVGANIEPETVRSYSSMNDDLMVPMNRIPSYADEIANHCEQFRNFRDTQGAGNYEVFRHIVGSMSLCEEGIELAHKWTEKRLELGHDQNDVDVKFNTWNGGFTLCSTFEKVNPEGCKNCPRKGKINSPISLGYKEVTQIDLKALEEKPTEPVEQANVELVEEVTEDAPPKLPQGYSYQNGVMIRHMKDKDGTPVAFTFTTSLFYPVARVRKENNEYCLLMRMHIGTVVRDFEIDTNLINTQAKLLDALGRYEITITHDKNAAMHLCAYMRDSLEKLKRETQEINTLVHFGWGESMEYYLLGKTLIHKDGTDREVLLGKRAQSQSAAFPKAKGSVAKYAEQINRLYADPGCEHYQYAIGSIFSSPLIPLGTAPDYKAVVLNLYGRKSGRGKTTVNLAALAAFGDPDKSLIPGSPQGYTDNYLFGVLSTYHNQAILLDETTLLPIERLAPTLYLVSNGQSRLREKGGKDGVEFDAKGTFKCHVNMTGNESKQAALASTGGDTAGESNRLIEIDVDSLPFNLDKVKMVDDAMRVIRNNVGIAGKAYLKYVVSHQAEVKEIIAKWALRFESDFPESEHRMYRAHGALSLAAIEITNMLEITDFGLEALYGFVLNQFRLSADFSKENNTVSPEQQLGQLILGLQPYIIITSEYRRGNDPRGKEQPTNPNIRHPVGRWITGVAGKVGQGEYDGRIYLIKKEVEKFCGEKGRRFDLKKIVEYAKEQGIFIPFEKDATGHDKKFTIGRGAISISQSNAPCICFDFDKYQELAGTIDRAEEERKLAVVKPLRKDLGTMVDEANQGVG